MRQGNRDNRDPYIAWKVLGSTGRRAVRDREWSFNHNHSGLEACLVQRLLLPMPPIDLCSRQDVFSEKKTT